MTDGGYVWLDGMTGTAIASFCRNRYGADVIVPVAHWSARRRQRTTFPIRSAGFDCRLHDCIAAIRADHLAGTSPSNRRRYTPATFVIGAEYIYRLREERPVGPDSLMVGFICALVFLEMNGIDVQCSNKFVGYLAARLPGMDRDALAATLHAAGTGR